MSRQRCKHDKVLCVECVTITDDARRIHDAINLAVVFHDVSEVANSWMCFSLQDGTSDNVLYPTQQAARDHQLVDTRHCYISMRMCLAGMPLRDAQLFLDASRHAAEAGMRIKNPADMIVFPQGREQFITRPVNPVTGRNKPLREYE